MTPEEHARSLLNHHWDGELPVNPIDIANKIGVRVFADQTMVGTSQSGRLSADGSGPIILVNAADSNVRRRFTIAHELGHHVLEHGPAFRRSDLGYNPSNYDLQEVHANRFAAELLMPASLVQKARDVGYLLPGMAALFGVSETAIRIRLTQQNLL